MCVILSIAAVSATDINNNSIKNSDNYDSEIMPVNSEVSQGTFTDLSSIINDASENSSIKLEKNYSYDKSVDGAANFGGITINKGIIIDGNGHNINADNLGRIFNVTAKGNLTLINVILMNGNVNATNDNYGGAIFNSGNLFLNNVTFENNSAGVRGGAIYNTGNLTIFGSQFIANNITASTPGSYRGSAICNELGNVTIENTEFTNHTQINTEIRINSIVYNGNGRCNINNSRFTNNVARWGGAVYSDKGSYSVNKAILTVNNTIFENNSAIYGGAIYLEGSKFDINNTVFNNNRAMGKGDIKPTDNTGGAICAAYSSNGTITNSNFTNNTGQYGGAINIDNTANIVKINNSVFKDNNATYGGSVFICTKNEEVSIANSTFINNTASELGNAIYDNNPYLVLSNNSFTGQGAPIYADAGSKLAFKVDISANPAVYGKNLTIYANITNNGILVNDPNFKFIINGKDYEATLLENGTYMLNYPVTSVETIKVNATIPNKAYNNLTINASKDNVTLNVSVNNIIYGENATITVKSTVDGIVNVTINDKNYTVNVTNGVGSVVVSGLNAGNYTVTADYVGNENYNAATNSTEFNVAKADVNLNVTVDDIIYGENATITVKSTVDGDYTVTVDGKQYNVTVKDGIGSVVVSGLNVGNHIVSATFAGNDYYNSANASSSFNVSSAFKLFGDNVVMYYKNGTSYVVVLTDSLGNAIVNKTLILNINGVNYTRFTDDEGKASIVINLPVGKYVMTVTSNDDLAVNTVNNITILSTIEGNDLVKYFHNGTQYYATFLDASGNPLVNRTVSFNINGIFYNKTTDVNGIARLNINLAPGKYILTATNPVNGQMFSNNITVVSTIEGNNLVKYFRNGTQFSVKVVNGTGAPVANQTVTFNINGVFYNKTTDVNGTATLNINLNPGEYIITSTCNGASVSNIIEVKSIIKTQDIAMSTSKRLPFNATILNGQGIPVANQTVRFNINGIFYHKVTDARGIASLNINLNPGKYIITSEYDNLKESNTIIINK